MILEPSVFLGFAPYLGHRSLQICAASCRQSFDHAYVSDVWHTVDFSQWRPLEGHIEPGDMDLIFALKRVPPGRLRRLVLRSRRISNDGFSAILLMQNQVEELVIDTNLTHLGGGFLKCWTRNSSSCLVLLCCVLILMVEPCKNHGEKGPYPFQKPPGSASCSCLSGDALALAPSLRRLELLGLPLSALAMSDRMDGRVSLETLVLQLPTLQDLQATWRVDVKKYQGMDGSRGSSPHFKTLKNKMVLYGSSLWTSYSEEKRICGAVIHGCMDAPHMGDSINEDTGIPQ